MQTLSLPRSQNVYKDPEIIMKIYRPFVVKYRCTDVVPFNPRVTHIFTTGGTNIEHKKQMQKLFFFFLSFVSLHGPHEFIGILSFESRVSYFFYCIHLYG